MLIPPEQQDTKPLVKWKDLLSGQWKGPGPLLTSGRGCACIFPQDADSPDRLRSWTGLDPGQADSPCCSSPDIRFPHCFDHKRGGALLCPCRCCCSEQPCVGSHGLDQPGCWAQCTALAACSPISICLHLLGHRWARGQFSKGAGAAPAGRGGKINNRDPGETDRAAATWTPTRK